MFELVLDIVLAISNSDVLEGTPMVTSSCWGAWGGECTWRGIGRNAL